MHKLAGVWREVSNHFYNRLCTDYSFCCAVSLLFFIPESLGKKWVSGDVKMPLKANEGIRGRLWAANAFIQDE